MRSLWILLLIGCGGARTPAATTTADVVDGIVAQVMAEAHVPGMAVAIVKDGVVRKARGYGAASLEWPSPVTTKTRFQIASSTKVLTGTLLMMLVEDRTLDLDRPVASYLPDAPPAWSEMTLRQLAAHAGGVADYLDSRVVAVRDAYEAVKTRPLRFPPGSRVQYGTGDFIVLVHVIETITKRSFEQLLEARIFQPLGFTCTSFEHETEDGQVRVSDVVRERATVYRRVGAAQRAARFLYPAYTYASGGAVMCLDDLVKWSVAMDRHALVSAAGEGAMAAAFHDGGFGVVFARGMLRGHAWYGHSGGPALADVLVVPGARLAVIVLTNQQKLVPNLAARIASEWLPPPVMIPIADPSPALTSALRAVAERVQRGTLADEALLAKPAELVPTLREWGPIQFAAIPPLDGFTLVAAEPTRRRYHATYGRVTGTWTFVFDATGKVVDLDFAIE